MRIFLTSGKRRVTGLYRWLFLFIIISTPILLLSQPALAQTEAPTDLTLRLRDTQGNINTVPASATKDNKFSLEVSNTGTKLLTNIRLSAQVPEGWIITIVPVSINSLNPGSLNAVDVFVRPAGKATSYSQPVTFTAQANEIADVKAIFNVGVFADRTITTALGRTELTLSLRDTPVYSGYPYSNYGEAKGGQDNKFFLDVSNSGNQLITNIKLTSESPAGWIVSINPPEITSLSVNNHTTVDVIIRPTGTAMKATQKVTFIAQSDQLQNVKSVFDITVKPAQSWVWVWVGAGVVLVIIFVLIFLRFNKQ